MADIPLDTTHLEAKARKGKRGDHPHHGRVGPRPTIRDFPKEWLPNQPTSTSPVAAS
jgi:small subunit ribosomal protein S35